MLTALLWAGFGALLLLTVGLPAVLAGWLSIRGGIPMLVFEISAGAALVVLAVQALVPAPSVAYVVGAEVVRYLSFRAGSTMRAARHQDAVLMAGLGAGAMNALALALVLAATVLPASIDQPSSRGLDATWASTELSALGVLALSRLSATACDIAFTTLVVLAYRCGIVWLLVAVVAHLVVFVTAATVLWLLVAWAILAALFVAWSRRAGWLQRPESLAAPVGLALR